MSGYTLIHTHKHINKHTRSHRSPHESVQTQVFLFTTRATLNAEIPLGRLDQCITPNSKHIGVCTPHPQVKTRRLYQAIR